MGYGSRALDLLEKYYEYNMINLDEPQPDDDEDEDRNGKGLRIVDEDTVGTLKPESKPRKLKLLLKLSERRPEKLDYLGVSFGLTGSLLKFWKKAGFIPLYLRQTANDLTGEYSCIMLKVLQSQSNADSLTVSDDWLQAFGASFRDRFISNLSGPFRDMSAQLALAMLHNRSVKIAHGDLTRSQMQLDVEKLQRLEHYARNLADYHLITDIMPTVGQLYCNGKLGDTHLSAVQLTILIGMGLQRKRADEIAAELGLPTSQLLGLFNKTVRKLSQYLNSVVEKEVGAQLDSASAKKAINFSKPLTEDLMDELDEEAQVSRIGIYSSCSKLSLDV